MRAFVKFSSLKFITIVFFLLLFLHIFILQNFLYCVECENDGNKNNQITFESKTTESSNILFKRVTKSLSDMKRLITLNDHILMFNHGPKCGSEMFILILKWLQGPNNFKHFRVAGNQKQKSILSPKHQRQVSEFVSKTIQDLATPVSFDSSSYFINFTQYGWDSPTYFGIVRDPGEMLKASSKSGSVNDSRFGNSKEPSVLDVMIDSSDLNIPYYCGHHFDCTMLNSDSALIRAKENVEKFYSTVGVIEYTDETLYVLEKKLKYFFRGATDIYQKKFQEKHTQWKKKLKTSETNGKEIRQILRNEYDFYNWIKSRLFEQVQSYQRQQYEKDFTDKTIFKNAILNFQIEEP